MADRPSATADLCDRICQQVTSKVPALDDRGCQPRRPLLSQFNIIGIILLIGIVKKNGIRLIDFALESQRERGLSSEDAIHEAEIRQPLGYAIVGGLLTPIVYIYMDRLSGWLSRRSRAQLSARAGTSKPQERS
jgi:AcrB/AcrD/AcrF family